ncbi:alpha/beta hydrolase-fold protein [Myxococcus sp. MISCRS1]|uniref:alpha/beta hydrolase n=1 Tax=Myxococcus TaxID=32 RepID=UPI00114482BE|nr:MULTISPECIES: alpha/beta hydrolase-fold protein [Myxococcus]MBZ4395106.1 alpha/beta hydrolase [Myxococcus sp. AS-1-15]MBZ4406900.1 alpha/beta hydrolase [Myxococcus sp. XM-1-1-1]MCK8502797.1 alpha/beta hydrolase-fold protein [Myxococcus fulvus]MCY1002089.1 alpha/beta hydrolase-fold protein [Myxococcus sp. MISCRS1]
MTRRWMAYVGLSLFLAGCSVRRMPPVAPEPVPPHELYLLSSSVLKEERRITVYLPPGYETAKDARFPVLYMPDGGLQEDFPHVASAVDAAIRAGEMRPLIVVGIENTVRRRDMTGPTELASDRELIPVSGGSAAFRAFIRDELLPDISRRYRVTEERAIIGESAAGLFIMETFFLQPELFDTYLALSPSLWWNGEALVKQAGTFFAQHPSLRARLYVSSANETEDIVPAVARLNDILQASAPAGLTWEVEPRPDLRHDNIYRSTAPALLRKWLPPVNTAGDAR